MQDAPEQMAVLRERRNWLDARIEAKQKVGWDTNWDRRERDALSWGLRKLEFAIIRGD